MLFEYNSNNSGGNWWLSDDDWFKLEKAGWNVRWIKDDKYFKKFCNGDRWLGALATNATKEFNCLTDAIEEFEKITGQDYYEQGCLCCGKPHTIYEAYIEGEENDL